MPYLMEATRERVEREREPENSGELNYLLTQAAIDYIARNGLAYSTINDVMGAFACAAQEFFRRVGAPYEDKKIQENGDVYPNF